MKISCPNCPAAYELDDARIPPAGLSIKCPRCKAPFIVHKPKPGDPAKAVKGSAVPLPGQPGAKSMPPRPAAARPPSRAVPLPGTGEADAAAAEARPASAPPSTPGSAVPLPGLGGDEPASPAQAQPAGLEHESGEAQAAQGQQPAVPLPDSGEPSAQAPHTPGMPLPGLGDEGGFETTSVEVRPPPRGSSSPPALDFGAVPLPGLDGEAAAPAPRPPAGSDPFGLDFDAPQDTLVDQPPVPGPRALSDDLPPPAPRATTLAMDDIFAVDLPGPEERTEPPPRPPPQRPSPIDEPGISFDFVEAPPPRQAPRPPPPPPLSAPPRSPGADLLDFVDDKPAEETALRPVDETAVRPADGKKPKRPPPPTIAFSTPPPGKADDELSLDSGSHDAGVAEPAAPADPKKAEKERKKQEKEREREERKQHDREERARRKAVRAETMGPLLSGAREQLRNPRVAGLALLGVVVLVVGVLGVRARGTPAGLFWMNKYIPSKKAASATETKVIDRGMERLADGSFAAAREALGMAAQLSAVLPDDENVKAFFVLSASELKLAYGQVGGDWDQARRVVEKMKESGWAQSRARGAFALATGDAAKGKALLAPLGDRPNADLESVYLYAQALILGGEQPRAAQLLDNALKGKGGDSTKLLLLRGLVARQKGQLPEAAGFFEKALEKSHGNGRALIELADVKLRQGDVKTTADLLDKTLLPEVRKSLDATEEARASMLRGRLLAVNHQNKDAEAAYERAVALDPASAEIREAYGDFRNSRREWEKAAKQFDAAINAGNATPTALAGAARAYLGTNRLLDADKRINDAVAKDNQNAHFIYLQGRVAEAIGKGDEAFKDYERALARKPDLAEALVAEGQIFLNRADKEKAQAKLDAALKATGRSSVEDEAVGDLALLLGQKEQARDAFAAALQKDPEDPQAHAGMGKTLAAMGELKPARVELEKALAEVDNDASLAYEYGSLLRRAGESDNALAALQKAVKIDGKDPRYRSRLGALLVERSDFEGAEAQLRQAVLMNDRYAEGQFFLARALAGQRKLAEAVDIAKRAVELDPDNAEYLYYLGLIYEQGQQVQDAIEALQRSIDKDPKSADAWEHLGQNLTVENRFGEAVNAFKKAAALDPRRARVWAEVADSEQQAGDLDGAIRDFQKALAQDASLPGVWSKLGVAYKDKDCKGCKARAMDALRRGEQLDPTDAVAHHELGYIYKDDGRRKEAISEFKRYLELRPDAGDLATVQDDIYYLQEESRRAP